MTNDNRINLSVEALALFIDLANDAPNWGGIPPLGCNITTNQQTNGYVTALKKAKLIKTYKDEGETWVLWTDAGRALAEQHGIKV